MFCAPNIFKIVICQHFLFAFQRGALTLLQHGSDPNLAFIDRHDTDEHGLSSPLGLPSPIGYILSPFQLIMKRLRIHRVNTDINLLKWLVRAGLDLNTWCNAHVLSKFGESFKLEREPRRGRALFIWLTQLQQNPKSLKQLTFEAIRRHLSKVLDGVSVTSHMDRLPLPALVISYLKLEDVAPTYEVDYQGFYNKKAVLIR